MMTGKGGAFWVGIYFLFFRLNVIEGGCIRFMAFVGSGSIYGTGCCLPGTRLKKMESKLQRRYLRKG
jgi:hypothetical protein